MASGSFQGSGFGYVARIQWSSTAGTGGSTVNATLYAQNVNNYYFYASLHTTNGKSSITIDGSTKQVGSSVALSSTANGKATILSHSKWVAYTGNKSITISGNIPNNYISTSAGTVTARSTSKTVALDKVGEKPTMGNVVVHAGTITTETRKTVEITWDKATSYNGTCTYGIGVSINGGSYNWVYPNNNINTTSYTYTLTNTAQGTKYQFVVAAKNDVGWSDNKYTGSITLNKLEPPSINDISTYNPFVNDTLEISFTGGSQLNGEKVYRYADLYYGSTRLKLCESVSLDNKTAKMKYPAKDYLAKLGNTKYSDKFKLVAWSQNDNGSRSSYVSKEFTVNINTDGNAEPLLDPMAFSGGILNNPTTCFVKGLNSITIKSGTATSQRAEGISPTISYTISTTAGYSSNGDVATFPCNSVGNYIVTVTATDSRGLSTRLTKDYIVQDYKSPTIKVLSAVRTDDDPTIASIGLEMSYCNIWEYAVNTSTKGGQLNNISKMQYRVNSGEWIPFTTNPFTINSLFTENIYDLEVRICDVAKDNTYSYGTYVIGSVKKDIAIRKGRVGINCIPQIGHALEVKGKGKFTDGLDLENALITNDGITSSLNTSKCYYGSTGKAIINSTYPGSGYKTLIKANSSNGAFTVNAYKGEFILGYQSNDSIASETNKLNHRLTLLDEDGNTLLKNIQCDNDLTVSNNISCENKLTVGNSIDVAKGSYIGSTHISGNEFIAMYNPDRTKRYFWMGRDGTWAANNKGYFFVTGEDNITQFRFNKDIYAPNLADSGWKSLTPKSPFALYDSARSFRYRKIGKVVYFEGELTVTSDLAGSSASEYKQIATAILPSGYRPATSKTFIAQGSGSYIWNLRVLSNGEIWFARYRNSGSFATAPKGCWLPFNVSFVAEENDTTATATALASLMAVSQ